MTTTETIVERLVTLAAAGRGLWIGLDVERNPRHELLRLELEEKSVVKLTEDTHVTIAHLGKQCGRREVEAAVTACHVLSRMLHVTQVSVEGFGRLRDHVVAILAPRWVDQVVEHVDRCLADHNVYPDRSFAGIRHASVATISPRGALVAIPRIDQYTLKMTELMVVCGGDEIGFELQPETAPIF